MKKSFLPAMLLVSSVGVSAQEDNLETIVVSGSKPVESHKATQSISALSGESYTRSVGGSVGDTVKNLPGVDSASFGSGVGLPVIRGQSGNRVRVLNNGLGVMDASAVSPDHGNSIDAFVAEGVEVVRGPATLLYGNGASGGVVNVLDRRIPEDLPPAVTGGIEYRHDTNNDRNTALLKLDGSAGVFAWHLDMNKHISNDTRIPGEAIIHEPGEEDEFNTDGFIGNSDSKGKGIAVGGSFIKDDHMFGLSYSYFANNYGLPEGSHAHHEEDPMVPPAMPPVEEEEAVPVRIDMWQKKLDLKGRLSFNSLIETIEGQLSIVDYQHKELEIEDEEDHAAHAEEHEPTTFSNEGYEAKVFARHSLHEKHSGNIGIHISETDFSVIGEEAFINESDRTNLALFIMQGYEFSFVDLELGFRVEEQDLDYGECGALDATRSFSGALLFPIADDKRSNILFSATHSNRAPTVEEYYSNVDSSTCGLNAELVLHNATSQIEIGNPSLSIERSNNIELAWRHASELFDAEITVFHNNINDFIYLQEIGETAEGEEIAQYQQQGAEFNGMEMLLSFSLKDFVSMSLFADYVDAELEDGENVPRIPPMSFGFSVAYDQVDWMAEIRAEHSLEQDDVSEHESESPSYTDISLYAEYRVNTAAMLDGQSVVVFGKLNNLLDEEIRNPVSFLKDYSPEPGFGVEVGARLLF